MSECPHCGNPYKDESNGVYTHAYVRTNPANPFADPVWKPAVLCSENHTRSKWNGYRDADWEDIR